MKNQTPSNAHKIHKQNLTSAVVGNQFTHNGEAGNCSTLKLLLVFALLIGCAGQATAAGTTGTQPGLAVSPSSLSLGDVNVGQVSSHWAKLTNTEKVSIVVSGATISNSEFSLGDITFPMTIPAGKSTSFYVRFKPVAGGVVNATVTFASNAAGAAQALAVRGNGIGSGATLSASPNAIAFGGVQAGASGSQTITLKNTGTASTQISMVSIAGSGFTMSALTLPLTLAGGQSVSLTAKFAPAAAGSATGAITIASNASDPTLTISLSGTGLEGQAAAAPGSVSFGNVVTGTSNSQTIKLSNTGNASLTITQASVSGAGMSQSGLTTPVTIAAGASASFNVLFAPTAAGTVSGSVSIISNASNATLAIPVTGTGVQAQVGAIPGSVSFGNVVTGSSNSQTIKLSNTGTASLTITQASVSGAGLSQSGLSIPLTIAAGGSTSFNVKFSPTATGAVSGSVSIVSNASNATLAIPVSGTGVQATAALSTNPASLNFGNVNDGSSSVLDVTLSNTGNSSVTISGVSASGAGFSASGVSSGLILAPNQLATMQVTFNPASAGAVSGSVTVSSNASNSPGAVALAGTGVQVGAKTVSLTWGASVTTDVTGYNIYRGTTQGVYAKLNSAPVAAVDFADSTVQSGANTTYYYTVTAVDTNNMESGDSNVVTALIP